MAAARRTALACLTLLVGILAGASFVDAQTAEPAPPRPARAAEPRTGERPPARRAEDGKPAKPVDAKAVVKPAEAKASDPKPADPKPAEARPGAAKPGDSTASVPRPGENKTLSEIGSSREPIAIDADRLDVFDKEGRAVFTGNVVAVQGDTTMNCKVMNVAYESTRAGGEGASRGGAAAGAGGFASNSAVKKIDCTGPVTITTKTQTATGDRAEFDRVANKVYLLGNAVLTDGPNVTRGERVAYDLSAGVARVEGGRVKALIVPGSDKSQGAKEASADGKPKERDAKPKPPR